MRSVWPLLRTGCALGEAGAAVAEALQRGARLGAVEQLDAPVGLALERGLHQVAEALVQDPLRRRDRVAAGLAQCLDPALDRGVELAWRDDLVREAFGPRD